MNRRSPFLRPLLATLSMVPLPLFGASGSGGILPVDPGAGPARPIPAPELNEVQILEDKNLKDVTSIVLAPGGRHAYAAAFNPSILSIHDRDTDTGALSLRKSLTDADHDGVVAFRLSHDGKLGAAACFRADSLILYSRDPESGDLRKLDVAGGTNGRRDALDFCVDCVFSPDGKQIYTIASRAIGVFHINDNRLVEGEMVCDPARIIEPPEKAEIQDPPAMKGGRGIAISPDGLTVVAAWNSSGTLTVNRRDPETGKLVHIQTIRDDGDEIVGMDGVFRVAFSRNGRHVYTSSGRFHGKDAVSCFELRNGTLSLRQSLLAKDLPPKFSGGNEIIVSPDQREVAVACSKSDVVALFHRDPDSGHLSPIGTTASGPAANPGPAGLCWSADGRFIHVADEESGALVTFRLRRR